MVMLFFSKSRSAIAISSSEKRRKARAVKMLHNAQNGPKKDVVSNITPGPLPQLDCKLRLPPGPRADHTYGVLGVSRPGSGLAPQL